MITFLLKLIFNPMEPGMVTIRRFFHRYNAAKNKTVIVISGPLSPHVLAGVQAVLEGRAHARHYPAKKRTPVWGRIVEGKGV